MRSLLGLIMMVSPAAAAVLIAVAVIVIVGVVVLFKFFELTDSEAGGTKAADPESDVEAGTEASRLRGNALRGRAISSETIGHALSVATMRTSSASVGGSEATAPRTAPQGIAVSSSLEV